MAIPILNYRRRQLTVKCIATPRLSFQLVAASVLMLGGVMVSGHGVVHFVPSEPVYYSPLPTSQDFDFNNDGVSEFTLVSDGSAVSIVPHGANAVLSVIEAPPDVDSYVVPIAVGGTISSSLEPQFVWYGADTGPAGHSTIIASMSIGSLGFWKNVDAYTGLQLNLGGQTYYGWMHIQNYDINAGQVFDWAYESSPNTPILAGAVPEPSTWALSGMGLLGIFVKKGRSLTWRMGLGQPRPETSIRLNQRLQLDCHSALLPNRGG